MSSKDALSVALPFALAVGGAYSTGYWGYFHIDALQFVSLVDVAKLAVYPLLFLALSTILSATYVESAFGPGFEPGAGADTRVGRFLRKFARPLTLLNILLVVAALTLIPDPFRWHVVSVLCVPLAGPLTHTLYFETLIPNARFRAILVGQVLLLPILAFAIGRGAAIRVDSGDSDLYVDAMRSSLPAYSSVSEPLVYIGKLGETYFVREPRTGKIVLFRLKDESQLVLIRKDG
ncbi:hypothetical protein [Ideonella sp. A 288]|uniref:hypothetical protein n=1 Tax=Ideonella sp. A 288 TaxID=1962181 RepID=UPI001186937C|nr:hypothetical protein [Ideonella sp. A 288]